MQQFDECPRCYDDNYLFERPDGTLYCESDHTYANKLDVARVAYALASDALHRARIAESEHTRFGVCHDYGQGLVQKTIDANTTLQAIIRDAIAQFGKADNGCKTCLHQSVFPGGPRHQASSACASGKNVHCSCNICF